MDLDQLKEIQLLIKLASRQTNEDLIYRVLKNLIKKLRNYKLDKEFREEYNTLVDSEKIEEKFLALSNMLGKVNLKISELESLNSRTLNFPDFITANKIVIEKIKETIKIKRVKEKLRYLLDNLNNKDFFRQHSKGFEKDRDKIDMFCINLIVTHGLTIRILYFVDNNKLRFCDFFINHDEYERAWSSKRYFRKYYRNENWVLIPRF